MKKNSIQNRNISLDLLRIVACFCVIVIHVGIYGQAKNWSSNSVSLMFYHLYGILCRWAVPCFVMLSGMMFLNKHKDIPIKKLYFKYILRLLVSYIFWSAVYSIYNSFYSCAKNIKDQLMYIINNFFSGETHMWYVLMLIGLYIAIPILKYLVNNLPDRLFSYWLIIMFVFSSLIPFICDLKIPYFSGVLSYFNEYINIQFLCGYTLYFVLGYYISNKELTSKQQKIIYVFGLIGFIYSVIILLPGRYFLNLSLGVLNYLYPNVIFMSLAVMSFFKNRVGKIRFPERTGIIIFSISKLTYGVFLIHVLVLKILYHLGFNLSICFAPISMLLISIVTYIISLIITFIISKIPFFNRYIC